MANHLCVCSVDRCRAERRNLTHWSVAAPWSRLSRPPGDGSSSPPAPHTLSCSLAGNIQNRCGTERSLKKHAVTFTFPSSHWVRGGPCQSQDTQTHTTHSHTHTLGLWSLDTHKREACNLHSERPGWNPESCCYDTIAPTTVLKFIPVIVIQCARTGRQFLRDSVISPVEAEGAFPQA